MLHVVKTEEVEEEEEDCFYKKTLVWLLTGVCATGHTAGGAAKAHSPWRRPADDAETGCVGMNWSSEKGGEGKSLECDEGD